MTNLVSNAVKQRVYEFVKMAPSSTLMQICNGTSLSTRTANRALVSLVIDKLVVRREIKAENGRIMYHVYLPSDLIVDKSQRHDNTLEDLEPIYKKVLKKLLTLFK